MMRAVIAITALLLASCGGSHEREGVDARAMPADVRADYAVFAQRCSKCHSLSRPLNSGIDDDTYWAAYVARMRRMPSSGISKQDEVVILRYLHYFSLETKREKAKTSPAADAPAPLPARDGGA